MTNEIYNDVGFMVGERLLILTEAQSSWTENIAVGILIYLMVTYQDYIRKTKQNVYKSKKIKLPRPEMYVVYTGDRKERPETISLAEEFFDGQNVFLDAKVKVLYGSGERYEAAQKEAREAAIQLIKMDKLSIEELAQCVPSLSAEDVKKMKEELLQSV